MFIQLFPTKSLQKTKHYSLLLGIFLVLGGSYALVRELILSSQSNILFAYVAGALVLTGLAALAFATDKFPLKETYFSMTPERVSFRTSLFGQEYLLYWNTIREIKITEKVVLFELKNGSEIDLALTTLPQPEIAKHISVSIRLAALEQNVRVNGVVADKQLV
jgi:hypothetical protein